MATKTAVKKLHTNNKSEETNNMLQDSYPCILCGTEYKMRRLATQDVFKFASILSKIFTSGQESLKEQIADVAKEEDTKNMTKEQVLESSKKKMSTFGNLVMQGFANNEKDIAEFCGGMIGMDAKTFLAQPPEFIVDFLTELPKHNDFASFFTTTLKTIAQLGSLWQR